MKKNVQKKLFLRFIKWQSLKENRQDVPRNVLLQYLLLIKAKLGPSDEEVQNLAEDLFVVVSKNAKTSLVPI